MAATSSDSDTEDEALQSNNSRYDNQTPPCTGSQHTYSWDQTLLKYVTEDQILFEVIWCVQVPGIWPKLIQVDYISVCIYLKTCQGLLICTARQSEPSDVKGLYVFWAIQTIFCNSIFFIYLCIATIYFLEFIRCMPRSVTCRSHVYVTKRVFQMGLCQVRALDVLWLNGEGEHTVRLPFTAFVSNS